MTMPSTKVQVGGLFTDEPTGGLGEAHAAIEAYLARCVAIEAARRPGQGGTYQENILVEIHQEAAALVMRSDFAPLLHAALDRIAWLDEQRPEAQGSLLDRAGACVPRLLERIAPDVALPAPRRIAAAPPLPRAQKAIAAAVGRAERQAANSAGAPSA